MEEGIEARLKGGRDVECQERGKKMMYKRQDTQVKGMKKERWE